MMLALEEFGKLLEQGKRSLMLCGFEVASRLFNEGEQIYLSTAVLMTRAQLAPSVLEIVREGHQIEGGQLDAFLREENGTIYLEYLGPMECESAVQYIHLLQEFIWIANEWRYRLDLKGKEDLVSIPIPIRF
jgi:hypothetical protein